MSHLHAVTVRFIAPTDTRPSCVSLRSGRHYADPSRVVIPWDHAGRHNIADQAAAYLTGRGFTVLHTAELNARESVVLVREHCALKGDPAGWRSRQ